MEHKQNILLKLINVQVYRLLHKWIKQIGQSSKKLHIYIYRISTNEVKDLPQNNYTTFSFQGSQTINHKFNKITDKFELDELKTELTRGSMSGPGGFMPWLFFGGAV